MKYYCLADVHGFYQETIDALTNAGYFSDNGKKKIIICGDILDRGQEANEMVDFVLDLMAKDQVILIKGNHEDLFLDLVDNLNYWLQKGIVNTHHFSNRTFHTLLDLSGMDFDEVFLNPNECKKRIKQHPFYKTIIPSMIDFYETSHYVFVHGYIPCDEEDVYKYDPLWRKANSDKWYRARWINGMKANHDGVKVEGKVVVCGHYHASFGHFNYHHEGSEFGSDAIFTPFYDDGIIAIDGCTAFSHIVNCVVLEDF